MAAFPEVKMVEGYPRYVKDRNRITGGGISSGLDEALYIIELILGTDAAISVQQVMQYYPDPPVRSKIEPSDCCPVQDLSRSGTSGPIPVRRRAREGVLVGGAVREGTPG